MDHNAIIIDKAYKVFHKDRLRRLRKKNGNINPTQVIAVDRVSFIVRRGEIFGVLGPNGSGKSTLIRLIATLLLPDDGEVSVFGHDVVREAMAVQRLINRVSVEAHSGDP
jgi:ABC-2 type transport system ATP-binding protein